MAKDDTYSPTFTLRTAADWDNWLLSIEGRLGEKECLETINNWEEYDLEGQLVETGDDEPIMATPMTSRTQSRTSGPETPPVTKTPTKPNVSFTIDSAKMATRKAKAYGTVLRAIDSSLYSVARPARTTRDPRHLLKLLHQHFFLQTGFNMMQLWDELTSLQLGENDTITDLVDRIDTISTELESQGMPIADVQKAGVFLKALPETYMFVVGQLYSSAAAGKQPSYLQARRAATAFETKIKRQGRPAGNSALIAANEVTRTPPPEYSRGSTSTKTERCERCLKQGHHARECRAPTPNTRNIPKGACYGCGRMGHQKKDCRSKNKKPTGSANLANGISFVVDSGATHHIVNNRNIMASTQPADITIRTADGQSMPVAASGTLKDFPGQALYVPSATENLLSVNQLTANGWKAEFDGDSA